MISFSAGCNLAKPWRRQEKKRILFDSVYNNKSPEATYKSYRRPRASPGWSFGRPRFLPPKDIINVTRECCKTSTAWTLLVVSQYYGVYVRKATIVCQHWMNSLAGNDVICQSVREIPTPSSDVPRVHATVECACSMAARACGTCNRESSGHVVTFRNHLWSNHPKCQSAKVNWGAPTQRAGLYR